ncbi:hypothetical protein [Kitasatospora fiedleri]|uniref:hypothetical protein n=1 Tax=Kitasatospora fiedleri TaxID=2991545 RepID=UPI00249C585C|nr:hypothetical protein [Kitasatospora fiedleri]
MKGDLRSMHARAVQAIQDDSPLANIRRASLLAASYRFSEISSAEADTSSVVCLYLADENSPSHAVSANDASNYLRRLQRAVARLAKARRGRRADVSRLFPADLALARLNVAAATLGSLNIELTPDKPDVEDNQLPTPGPSWAEIGIAELIHALPDPDESEAAIDSLIGASPVVKRAVSDLVDGLNGADITLGISLRKGGKISASSRITSEQAREIKRRLDQAREDRYIVRILGRLDGLRTRRQLFYFETRAGSEIHGFVEESLINAVKQNIDKEVEITVEVTIQLTQSGKASQRHYRLVAIGGVEAELPGLGPEQ